MKWDNLVLSALRVAAGPFAPDITGGISGPNALDKLTTRRAYLGLLRCEVPTDDLEAISLVVKALDAVPTRWLEYPTARRFIQNQVAKSQALSSADKDTKFVYALICSRMNQNVP